ncbi:hypothetical protein EMMF5_005648 [Cystobasidiomycetes sp. EMM_F5]
MGTGAYIIGTDDEEDGLGMEKLGCGTAMADLELDDRSARGAVCARLGGVTALVKLAVLGSAVDNAAGGSMSGIPSGEAYTVWNRSGPASVMLGLLGDAAGG